jgi:AcrR family transcriptional regulator
MGDTPLTTEAPPVQGRRERNKQRVRNRIYDAAVELFTFQGYDQTTVDEITEAADVARGTFFNHFQRKEDLVAEWSEKRRERLRDGLTAEGLTTHGSENTRQALLHCMSLLAEMSLHHSAQTRALLPAWVRAGFALSEEPFLSHMFARFVEEGQKRGEVPDTVDATLVGHLLRDVYLGTLYRWIRPEAGFDVKAELHEACRTVLDGVLTH